MDNRVFSCFGKVLGKASDGFQLDRQATHALVEPQRPRAPSQLHDGGHCGDGFKRCLYARRWRDPDLENQPPQSAVVIKLVDTAVAKTAPTVTAQVPSQSKAGETIAFSAQADPGGVPALGYHWDFGDGTVSEGPNVSHCYTRAADFTVRLTVDGPDDVPYEQSFSIGVTGELKPTPELRANRRFEQPGDKTGNKMGDQTGDQK